MVIYCSSTASTIQVYKIIVWNTMGACSMVVNVNTIRFKAVVALLDLLGLTFPLNPS